MQTSNPAPRSIVAIAICSSLGLFGFLFISTNSPAAIMIVLSLRSGHASSKSGVPTRSPVALSLDICIARCFASPAKTLPFGTENSAC